MIGSILVGLDGSDFSRQATELGLRWARPCGANLAGVAVVDEPTIRQGEMVPLGGAAFKSHRDETRLADAQAKVNGLLAAFAETCRQTGVGHQTIHACGHPADEIVRQAAEHDLILLGRQTFFHFETSEMPCDTLPRVLKTGLRPVVAVPKTLPEGDAVVVAYDGSPQAVRTLQMFQAVGLPQVQNVHVVSVDADHDTALRHVRTAAHFLGHHKIDAQVHPVVTDAAAGTVVLEHADRLKASLIVMGCYSQPTFVEFFFGSVTQSILNDARIPLFLYH